MRGVPFSFFLFTFTENVALVYSEKSPTATFDVCQPNLPLTDEEGRYASWGGDYYIESENARKNHPFASYENVTELDTTFDVVGGFSASVMLLDGLSFTSSFSGNYTGEHNYVHSPVYYTMWYEDGTPLLSLFGISSPVARGLALGASAHGIGTARAVELGAKEGAVAGLAIGLMGVVTSLVILIFRNFLL